MSKCCLPLVYLTIVICSFVIQLQIYSKNIYVRQESSNINYNITQVASNEWPRQMKVGLRNYLLCCSSDPNVDLKKEDLIDAWNLPPKTRLSPIMENIARCKLAAKNLWDSKGIVYDSNKCYCFESRPSTIFVYAWFSMAFYTFYFLGACCGAVPTTGTLFKWVDGILLCITWTIWHTTHLKLILYGGNIGLSYTIYGDIDASQYYDTPIDWGYILVLVRIILAANALEIMLFACAVARAEAKKLEGNKNRKSTNDESCYCWVRIDPRDQSGDKGEKSKADQGKISEKGKKPEGKKESV